MSILTIDESKLDNLPSNSDQIRSAARALKRAGKKFDQEVTDAKQKWTGIGPLYEGPGESKLSTSMAKPATDAGDLLSSTASIKEAATTLAEAIDALNKRKDTFKDTTLVEAEAAFKREYPKDETTPTVYALNKYTEKSRLQKDWDKIVADWEQAQKDFNESLDGIDRVSSKTTAHFNYGSNAYSVNQTERLYKAATGPNATTDDIEAYYAHVATLDADEMAAFAATNPEARITPPPMPTTPVSGDGFPTGVHGSEWWGKLDDDQTKALIAALPALVGNTNGVPYSKRSEANKNTLALVRNDPAFTKAQREAFESIAKSLRRGEDADNNKVPRSLLHFIPVDPASDRPLASVSVGNVDTADDVTVTVSGMGSGTDNMDGEVDNGQNIYNSLDGSRAVVTWIGYDSPDKPDMDVITGIRSAEDLLSAWGSEAQVLRNHHANTGGTQLAHFLDGMHETRDAYGDVPTTNVTAHSYGTTTAAVALTQTEHDVDRYVMYGSAGIDPAVADHASDFNVKDGPDGKPQVYATMAYDDPLAPAGQIASERLSPTAKEFGAQVFSSDGQGDVEGAAGNVHYQTDKGDDEWGYLEPGSQSFNTIDKILSGEAEDVGFLDEAQYDSDPKAQWVALEEAVEFKNDPEGYIEDKKDDFSEWVGDKKEDAENWVSDKKEDAENWAGEKKDDLVRGAEIAKDEVLGFVDDRRQNVEDGLEWADRAKDEALERARETADDVENWTDDRKDELVRGASKAKDEVEEFAEERKEDLDDARKWVDDKIPDINWP